MEPVVAESTDSDCGHGADEEADGGEGAGRGTGLQGWLLLSLVWARTAGRGTGLQGWLLLSLVWAQTGRRAGPHVQPACQERLAFGPAVRRPAGFGLGAATRDPSPRDSGPSLAPLRRRGEISSMQPLFDRTAV